MPKILESQGRDTRLPSGQTYALTLIYGLDSAYNLCCGIFRKINEKIQGIPPDVAKTQPLVKSPGGLLITLLQCFHDFLILPETPETEYVYVIPYLLISRPSS